MTSSRSSPLVVEPERRDPEPLLPDLGRGRVVGAVGRAPDVRVVGAVQGPEEEPVAGEDGKAGGEVPGGGSPRGRDRSAGTRRRGGGRPQTRPGSRGRRRASPRRGPGCTPPGRRARPSRRVIAVEKSRLEFRIWENDVPQHRLPHLVHDADEAVLDDGDGDRIGKGAVRGHSGAPSGEWTPGGRCAGRAGLRAREATVSGRRIALPYKLSGGRRPSRAVPVALPGREGRP